MAILKNALRLSATASLFAFAYAMPAIAEKPKYSGQNFVDQQSFNDRGRGNRGARGDRRGRDAEGDRGRRGDRGGRGNRQNFQANEQIHHGGGQITQAHHRGGRRGNFRDGRRGNFHRGGRRGFNRGFDRGFNRGFRQGRRQGFNRGYNRGYRRGFHPGFNRGFRSRGFYGNRFYGYKPYRGFNGYYGPRFRRSSGFNYVPAYSIGGFYSVGANTIIINDFGGYGLYAPPSGYHWVCDKGSNDAILASVATGAIIGLAVGVLAESGGY
ncbi:MAG: RcnB family protein [Pseudomonadota bacterium]